MVEDQPKSTLLRVIGFAIWACLMAAVGFGFWQLKRQNDRGTVHIAQFVKPKGVVRSRAEDSVVWRSAEHGAKLYEGDRVSTGRSSSATINFGRDRAIKLGPDSLVVVSAIREGSDYNFIVNVQKGNVVAAAAPERRLRKGTNQAPATAPLPLQVKVGAKTLTVDAGKKLEVQKVPGEAPKIVQMAALTKSESKQSVVNLVQNAPLSKPVVSEPSTDLSSISGAASGLASIGGVAAIPPVDPTNTVALSAKPLGSAVDKMKGIEESAVAVPFAKDLLPTITNPPNGKELWAFRPLNDLGQVPLNFELRSPTEVRGKSKDFLWRPLIEVGANGSGEHVDGLVLSGTSSGTQSVSTTFNAVAKRGRLSRKSGIPLWTLEYREGALVKPKAKPAETTPDGEEPRKLEKSYSKRSRTLNVLAIGDIKEGPVTIKLDQLGAQSPALPDNFVDAKQPLVGAQPFVGVRLASAKDLPELMGWVYSANAAQIDTTPMIDEQSVCIVRGQKVVAQIFGTDVGLDEIKKIAGVLRSDLVYRGKLSAFLDTESRKGKSIAEVARTMIARGQAFYVLSGDTVVAINRDFVTKNGDVARFVESNAGVIFTSPIEVLSSKW